MRTHRLLVWAGIAATAISLTGCVVPPHHGHGRDGPSVRDRDGDGRYDRYDRRGDGDRDGDRGRWERGDRPGGPPPGGYGPRY